MGLEFNLTVQNMVNQGYAKVNRGEQMESHLYKGNVCIGIFMYFIDALTILKDTQLDDQITPLGLTGNSLNYKLTVVGYGTIINESLNFNASRDYLSKTIHPAEVVLKKRLDFKARGIPLLPPPKEVSRPIDEYSETSKRFHELTEEEQNEQMREMFSCL